MARVNQFLTYRASQTKKLGRELARTILKEKSRSKALVLALEGELGSGKTTFLQGFAQGLDIKEKILSPTFILVRKFKVKNSKFKSFYHLDCYRVKNKKELLALGFREIISHAQNIVAIEWADRVKTILPTRSIKIKFKLVDRNSRKIQLTASLRII